MLDSIYVSLTGLTGFSDGLRNISNNVANVNTVGFKGTELQFQDLFYRFQAGLGQNSGDQSSFAQGSGLNTGGTTILFKQGDLRQTGNDLDTALTGNGFFVLHKDNDTLFTRDGQFNIDQQGFLVNRAGDARVQGLVNGQLVDINTEAFQVDPPKATSNVKFTGNLSTNDSDGKQVISNLTVIDGGGGSQTLTVTFTDNKAVTPGSWLIVVADSSGNQIANGEVRFSGDGSPQAGFNAFTFNFTPAGAPATSITFDFGTPGGFSGATNFSAGPDSTLAVSSQDGFASGSITKATMDTKGNLVLTYSNGQTKNAGQVALAWFNFLQGLEPVGASSFENNTGLKMQLGTAGTSIFGTITAGSVEGSNIDLGQEFTDLVVIQRGYQSSSEVITVANEMIQTLLDIKGQGK